jgi:hypothetical protein
MWALSVLLDVRDEFSRHQRLRCRSLASPESSKPQRPRLAASHAEQEGRPMVLRVIDRVRVIAALAALSLVS